MTTWRPGRAALWGAAAALVASGHVTLAAWAMRQHLPGTPATPDGIAIELAPPELPTPASAPAGRHPDQFPGEESFVEDPDEGVSAPDFTPPPIAPLPPPETVAFQPPPVPDFMPPPLVSLPPFDFASLAAKQVPSLGAPPRPRPDRIRELAHQAESEPDLRREADRPGPLRERPHGERRVEQRHGEPQARQGVADASRSGVRQQRKQAAPGIAPRAASAGQMASWQRMVGGRITAHMSRTRMSGVQGGLTAAVTVTIQPNGRATARLARGSGDPRVDQALRRQAGRMPRMPAPPGGKPASFTVPFRIDR